MGQNSSTQLGSSSPRRSVASPRRAKAPPTPAPPPKPPTYAVAENRVIPGGTEDMAGARRLLRPVSQELTKFHPDFADIFTYDPEVDGLQREGVEFAGNDENANPVLSNGNAVMGEKDLGRGTSPMLPEVTPGKLQNGESKFPASTSSSEKPKTNNSSQPLSNNNSSSSSSGSNTNPTSVFTGNGTGNTTVNNNNNNNNNNNTQHQPTKPASNIRRSQSMEARPRPNVIRTPQGPSKFHKRQLSVTPAIPEDPREHLYNVARLEPFSNATPSNASLPLASSFGLDYSFNVTYAQLADFRRKQRQENMGQKLEDLGAEIRATSTVPKSPFDRNNIGEKSATRSVSTGSSETGVSKSKKKKAPAPPPPANVPPLAPMSGRRDQSPSKLSMTTEPPADYDMGSESPTTPSPPVRGRALHRSASSGGERATGPDFSAAAARLALRNSGKEISPAQLSSTDVTSMQQTQAQPQAPPPPPPPPPAPPLPPGMPGALKLNTQPGPDTKPPGSTVVKSSTVSTEAIPNHSSSLRNSVAEAKAQLAALKKLEEALKNSTPAAESAKLSSPNNEEGENTEDVSESLREEKPLESIDITVDDLAPSSPAATPAGSTESKPGNSSTPSTPRMSSLLQHDIILAATARGAKVVKAKPPPVLEKPKDISEMFREELAKAATAREERRSRIATSMENVTSSKRDKEESELAAGDPSLLFESSFLKVSKKPPPTMAKPERNRNAFESPTERREKASAFGDAVSEETSQKPHQGASLDKTNDESDSSLVSKRPSIQSEDMSISSSNASQRVFPHNWTPEDDLDSDDDIMNEDVPPFVPTFGHARGVSNEGFKSSVLPTKIDSLKKEKNKKKKDAKQKQQMKTNEPLVASPRQQLPEETKKTKTSKTKDSPPDSEDRDDKKFGSIRKFQQSVHKGVKNAFGSISKASGKLLKRRKSQDFLDMVPADFSAEPTGPSEVSTNPNWALSDSRNGSLRRVASEGHMPISAVYPNGTVSGIRPDGWSSSSSESESSGSDDSEAEDDIGDIDFAAGIDRVKDPRRSRSRKKKKNVGGKAMKRAGVAYVNAEGKIIVLPEHETSSVDRKRGKNAAAGKIERRLDDNATSPRRESKFVKRGSKKHGHQERQERVRSDAPDLYRQEHQGHQGGGYRRFGSEETDMRRLQELEVQDRLHRLQTAKMQEQITLLQQHQLQRSHADLSNSNKGEITGARTDNSSLANGVVPNSLPAFYSGQVAPHMNSNGYLPHGQLKQQSSGGSATSLGVDPSFHRFSMPSFPSAPASSHILPHISPRVAATVDPSHYTAHSAPLVGGGDAGGLSSAQSHAPGSTPFPNMSPQELAYLSEYMRGMGVTPPSTQQQWAVLLSTFTTTTNNNNISNNNNNHNPLNKNNFTNNYTYHSNTNNLHNNINTSGLHPNLLLQGFPPFGNPSEPHLRTNLHGGGGPDLSTVLGGGVKSLDSTTSAVSRDQQLSLVAPSPASNHALNTAPYVAASRGDISTMNAIGHAAHVIDDDTNTTLANNGTPTINMNSSSSNGNTNAANPALLYNTNTTLTSHSPAGDSSGHSGKPLPNGVTSVADGGLAKPDAADVKTDLTAPTAATTEEGASRGVSMGGVVGSNSGVYAPLGFRQVLT